MTGRTDFRQFAESSFDYLDRKINRVLEILQKNQERLEEHQRERRAESLRRAIQEVLFEPEFSHATWLKNSVAEVYRSLIDEERAVLATYEYDRRVLLRLTVIPLTFLIFIVLIVANFLYELIDSLLRPASGRIGFAGDVANWINNTVEASGVATRVMLVPPLVCVIAVAFLIVWGYISSIRDEWKRLRRELHDRVRPLVREIINTIANERYPTALLIERAPGLSAQVDPRFHIPRAERQRLETLIYELGASAVAVSGPRGAGKTTLLRNFNEDPDARRGFIVSVDAPSSYEARDFAIHLYRRLCETVLDNIEIRGKPQNRVRFVAVTATRRVLRLAALAAAVGLGLWWWRGKPDFPYAGAVDAVLPKNLTELVVWIVGLLTINFLLSFITLKGGLDRDDERMLRLARTEKQRLTFLQNLSTETSAVAKFKVGFDLGRKFTRQYIEQSASYPEVVGAYRRFAQEVAEWLGPTRHKLVLVIDELDRIVDGEAAERFINEIKGVFGIDGCTYLVTVSEDALALFERRMVGIRPALDSTFDEVLRLNALDFEESVLLLTRRLVGFPRPFIALCHALAGGVPRELVRAARALVDAKRSLERHELDQLAREIVNNEIRRLKSGLIPRINSAAGSAGFDRLLLILADDSWPKMSAAALLDESDRLLAESAASSHGRETERTTRQLAISLLYYGTILEVFIPEEVLRRGESLSVVAGRLAAVRGIMPTSTDLALARLLTLRADAGLGNNTPAPVQVRAIDA